MDIIDKIGILVLATSNKRDEWKNIKETYLFNFTIKTFLYTMDKEHEYIFYIGIDKYDRIFDNEKEQNEVIRLSKVFPNVIFRFISFDNIPKGYVTLMWNRLYDISYKENCIYFYQCGDDIIFKTKGWINACIHQMKKTKGIGLTGPINNNNRILTQAFVTRRHMAIFGWFFPKEIKNWCCDDWYNYLYSPIFLFPLKQHFCANVGGVERYDIDNNANFSKNLINNTISLRNYAQTLATDHKKLIYNYIKRVK